MRKAEWNHGLLAFQIRTFNADATQSLASACQCSALRLYAGYVSVSSVAGVCSYFLVHAEFLAANDVEETFVLCCSHADQIQVSPITRPMCFPPCPLPHLSLLPGSIERLGSCRDSHIARYLPANADLDLYQPQVTLFGLFSTVVVEILHDDELAC